ncbi:nucleoside triphosphate pyrophosphohydrolase family protein [Tuberibacillus sp. Marseille-P3662]|uniref:nucleoside triphosphate pyrophosphohydrolase family protein n=1 Tax=Tuberibacillus sp. Marseille-P3662 TaxID=1965358 RepID=UPI000A1CABDB|nr:nucleoside triphosphate pyrophosphohydrolase family protein [Tuberibacillus sp. Marseille-P3662]
MNINDYQKATERTAGKFDDLQTELVAWAMGIGGESGEVVDAIKKIAFHGHYIGSDEARLKIVYELGDLLFYITRMADALGYDLDEVTDLNIKKLEKRYPNGFDPERSRNRDDNHEEA